jgi:hypothetical protein
MLGLNPALGPCGEESFQPPMPKSLDRHQNECNVYSYISQSG